MSDYYVNSAGDDGDDGSLATPWLTLAKVMATALAPGDNISLNRGDTFTPAAGFTVNQSGAAGTPITFTAYGAGAKPIIVGPGGGAVAFNLANRSYVDVVNIDVQANAAANYGFYIGPGHHITLTDCEASGSLYGAIMAFGAPADVHHITIHGCVAHDCASFGITSDCTPATSGPTDVIIEDCVSYNNGVNTSAHHGIYCKYSPGVIVRRNECYGNASGGIKINSENTALSATGAQVYDNYCHDNRYGIIIAAENGFYYNNLIYNCTSVDDYGVGIYWINPPRSIGNTVVHNTVVNSQLSGLAFYQDAVHTGNVIKNNLVMQDNAVVGDKKCIWLPNNGVAIGAGNAWDYNQYWADGTPDNHLVDASGDKTFAQWQALAGEANSANSDPTFVTEFTNLHLQVGSPAIARGDPAVGVLTDKDGLVRGAAVDAGAYEYEDGAPLLVDAQVTQVLLEADIELDDPQVDVTQVLLEADVITDDANLQTSQLIYEVAIDATGANVQISQLVDEVALFRTPGLNVSQLLHEIVLDSEATANLQVSQIVYEVAIYVPLPTTSTTYLPSVATHHRSVSLPISLWRPTIGSYTPRGQWIGTLENWDSYSHTISRLGGYQSAEFSISGAMADVDWWLDEGLGTHVEVHDETQNLIWEGFVDEISANVGGLSVSRGPLMDIANRAQVSFSQIDNTGTVVLDEAWWPGIGTFEDDDDSRTRYGTLWQSFSGSKLMTAEAEQVALTYLRDMAWPRTSKEWSFPGESKPEIQVSCKGYSAFLDRTYYCLPWPGGAGATDPISTKIANVLDADTENALFSSVNASIEVNTVAAVRYENTPRSVWEILKALVALGGSTGTERYNLGVYANRHVTYERWPDTLEYRQRIADPHLRTELASGLEVMPWNILPGKWLMFPDLLIGRVPPGTPFHRDQRAMLIREVTYRAPYEVQLSQEDPDVTEGYIAQIALRDQAW